MTNATIRKLFAVAMAEMRNRPRGQYRSLSMKERAKLWGHEIGAIEYPRLALAFKLRMARREPEPEPHKDDGINKHEGYAEDVRNIHRYGPDIARELRNIR